MKKRMKTEEVDRLFDAIAALESRDEFYEFFDDICTTNEILSIAQRLEVARMLCEKKTYNEIAAATGASTATISRVNRSINDGNGSYDYVFERLKRSDS